MSNLYVEAGGKTYLHYANWLSRRAELCTYLPQRRGHFRADVELSRPAQFLSAVRVDRNPHSFYDAHSCFYACDDWSTVFGVHAVTHPDGTDSYRFLIESNHPEPLAGERVMLFSTSCSLWSAPWGWTEPNVFAFFRNRFWLVSHLEFFGRWKGNLAWPLTSRHPDNYRPDDFLPPSHAAEAASPEVTSFLSVICKNPADQLNWLVFMDWLQDRGVEWAEYVREVLAIGQFNWHAATTTATAAEWHAATTTATAAEWHAGRPANIRTAGFLLIIILQIACKRHTRWPGPFLVDRLASALQFAAYFSPANH